ncbi:MAG TPA: hypothetical protein VKT80_06305, partial [Chloroflexota bacterium]|nr:hypothetical protein [Chloroflexota bacterium]
MRSSFRVHRSVAMAVLLAFVASNVMVGSGPSDFDHSTTAKPSPAPSSIASLQSFPLAFEDRSGGSGAGGPFVSRAYGYTISLTASEAVLTFPDKFNANVLRTRLVGADPQAKPVGLDPLPVRFNYLIGNDPSRWKTDVLTYGRIRYDDVYPGIDLIYHGTAGEPEYDFVVNPGGQPGAIALDFSGASGFRIDADGDLVLSLASGEIVQHRPVMYQQTAGGQRPVSGGFVGLGPNRVGLEV